MQYIKRPVFWVILLLAVAIVAFGGYLFITCNVKGEKIKTTQVPGKISIEFYRDGNNMHGLYITEQDQKQIVLNAINDFLVKSAAWPSIEFDKLKNRISIYVWGDTSNEQHSEYYVFDLNGKHCMQIGKNGNYSIISDEVYAPLRRLALGYYLPYTMTVKSGGNTIQSVGYPIWSLRKKDNLAADMRIYRPEEIADYIDYIEIHKDPESLTPFTPYVNGEKVYGEYTLYNEKFEKVPFFRPSGLEPQTYIFSNASPGKYIVELRTSFENAEEKFGNQYFFGVIIP